ncbi:serine/threonine protein kinase [Deinococcus koreensis]|uniref:Serine/threonine protein kinase n=1 Tax=Deinococcus koreensis TaxID=2054903 RepID=A0A2K3V2Q9_9DEIO|nr:serine/threonine protein kinase [Deinococcus koreensis]
MRCEAALWQGRPVFVKTLGIDDPDALARFQHEGRVAASLSHPQIVSPIAASETQLIFPFVEGGTLRECLMTGALSPAQATEVALGVLNAVSYLHAQGVTHHDLKPENVLLADGEPGFWNVRVVDFGMSHSRQLPLDIHSGTRMGTPHFMAPEQFRGVRGDARSDLYSVGVLLFDCLAGHPPFEDALGWLAGLNQTLAPLPGPVALHAILTSTLARDPALRPASANELRFQLCQARQQLGLGRVADRFPDVSPCP